MCCGACPYLHHMLLSRWHTAAHHMNALDRPSVIMQVVLRQSEPNSHIPAYVSGLLAWGTPPTAGSPDASTAGSGKGASSAASTSPGASSLQDNSGEGGFGTGPPLAGLFCCKPVNQDPNQAYGAISPALALPPADWQAQWQQRHAQAVAGLTPGINATGSAPKADAALSAANRGTEAQQPSGTGGGQTKLRGGAIAGIGKRAAF